MSKFDSLFKDIKNPEQSNYSNRAVDKVNEFYTQITEFCDHELPALKAKSDVIPMFTKKLAAWSEFWRSFDKIKELYNQGLDK